MSRFPKAYDNDVPAQEGDRGLMEYVDFDNMGIGSRPSGVPRSVSEGPKPITHTGGDASSGGRKRSRARNDRT
jgi:hypothetical protein